jgi:hypothetical protein
MQVDNELPEHLPRLREDTSDLLRVRSLTAPAFLQRNISPCGVTVSNDNADELAEAVATSPGPLGCSMPPEEWFDGLVVSYLEGAWERHASAIDLGVHAVTTVRCPPCNVAMNMHASLACCRGPAANGCPSSISQAMC